MQSLRSALLATAASLLGAAVAHAQGQTPGLYLGVQGGWTHLDSPSFTATDTSDHCCTSTFKLKVDNGFGAGGTIGYESLFMPGLRLEGEVTYRENGLKSMTNSDGFFGPTPISGNINSKAGMVNVLYDFLPQSPWTPYVGLGV